MLFQKPHKSPESEPPLLRCEWKAEERGPAGRLAAFVSLMNEMVTEIEYQSLAALLPVSLSSCFSFQVWAGTPASRHQDIFTSS